MSETSCIFCKIARKEDSTTVIEYESETIVIFKDIHPASKFHFLAIPKVHIKNAKVMTKEHIPLLEEMKQQLTTLILQKAPETPPNEISLGFHWPPFNSVNHLHMHAIAPESAMNFVRRQMFLRDTFWYRQADKVIEMLSKRS